MSKTKYTEFVLNSLMQIKTDVDKTGFLLAKDVADLLAYCASETIYRDELERYFNDGELHSPRVYH